MDTQAGMPLPKLFTPHPNLGDAVNHNFIASEVEGGVFLDQLPPGTVLCVETRNRSYILVNRGNGEALISGHPTFCRPCLANPGFGPPHAAGGGESRGGFASIRRIVRFSSNFNDGGDRNMGLGCAKLPA